MDEVLHSYYFAHTLHFIALFYPILQLDAAVGTPSGFVDTLQNPAQYELVLRKFLKSLPGNVRFTASDPIIPALIREFRKRSLEIPLPESYLSSLEPRSAVVSSSENQSSEDRLQKNIERVQIDSSSEFLDENGSYSPTSSHISGKELLHSTQFEKIESADDSQSVGIKNICRDKSLKISDMSTLERVKVLSACCEAILIDVNVLRASPAFHELLEPTNNDFNQKSNVIVHDTWRAIPFGEDFKYGTSFVCISTILLYRLSGGSKKGNIDPANLKWECIAWDLNTWRAIIEGTTEDPSLLVLQKTRKASEKALLCRIKEHFIIAQNFLEIEERRRQARLKREHEAAKKIYLDQTRKRSSRLQSILQQQHAEEEARRRRMLEDLKNDESKMIVSNNKNCGDNKNTFKASQVSLTTTALSRAERAELRRCKIERVEDRKILRQIEEQFEADIKIDQQFLTNELESSEDVEVLEDSDIIEDHQKINSNDPPRSPLRLIFKLGPSGPVGSSLITSYDQKKVPTTTTMPPQSSSTNHQNEHRNVIHQPNYKLNHTPEFVDSEIKISSPTINSPTNAIDIEAKVYLNQTVKMTHLD